MDLGGTVRITLCVKQLQQLCDNQWPQPLGDQQRPKPMLLNFPQGYGMVLLKTLYSLNHWVLFRLYLVIVRELQWCWLGKDTQESVSLWSHTKFNTLACVTHYVYLYACKPCLSSEHSPSVLGSRILRANWHPSDPTVMFTYAAFIACEVYVISERALHYVSSLTQCWASDWTEWTLIQRRTETYPQTALIHKFNSSCPQPGPQHMSIQPVCPKYTRHRKKGSPALHTAQGEGLTAQGEGLTAQGEGLTGLKYSISHHKTNYVWFWGVDQENFHNGRQIIYGFEKDDLIKCQVRSEKIRNTFNF